MAEDSGDVLDSWEDQVDSGVLDERLEKISVSKPEQGEITPPVMMQEFTGRTEYKPQVRILKRQPNSNSNGGCGNSPLIAKVNKPMKTLEQREAEYAEARMRIFGATEPSDPECDDTNGSAAVSSISATNNAVSPLNNRQFKINKADVKADNSIIRQPLGPDGSKGFHSNR